MRQADLRIFLTKIGYYYSKDNSTLEIDFVIQNEELYAIEVKAEGNVKSKSLKTIHENNSSVRGVRFPMLDYKEQDWMTAVPLYGVGAWLKSLEGVLQR